MSTEREVFEGQTTASSEARWVLEGGCGGPPPEIFRNLYIVIENGAI